MRSLPTTSVAIALLLAVVSASGLASAASVPTPEAETSTYEAYLVDGERLVPLHLASGIGALALDALATCVPAPEQGAQPVACTVVAADARLDPNGPPSQPTFTATGAGPGPGEPAGIIILLCIAGGPVAFGICLTVLLVLLPAN